MNVRVPVILLALAALAAGCLGGQTKQARERSEQVGNQSGDVPPATLHERNWKEAAQGHDAAGSIPKSELARMEEASAPGARASEDAGD